MTFSRLGIFVSIPIEEDLKDVKTACLLKCMVGEQETAIIDCKRGRSNWIKKTFAIGIP